MDDRTDEPFVTYVERWLKNEGVSVAALATNAGVDRGHLYRVLKRQNFKTPSAELIARVAGVLDLPADFFPEFRESQVLEAVRDDSALRDRLYRELSGSRRHRR